ncbi:MAG: T9SS type A sorting domain-containing protein [Clostridium sp.]|nr:T9SS type A sorting domain-containing protein [Prevotella sp.]MCM1429088.1 T9SS type A sorting domain-containing protein [Clostridium sp.]MCM1475382.1 T9SS type A sorting domain-containing protein [Muribaculaceae bacterium]
MKKLYIASFAVLAAMSANAQFVTETPYMEPTVSNGQIFDLIVADQSCIDGLTAAGKTVNDYRTNDETRWLYVWENTMNAGDSSYPGVGYKEMQFEGYPSFVVSNIGWSGAGFNINKGAGINLSHWTDETRFHCALMTQGTAPESLAFVIANYDDENQKPGNIAVGAPFNDNGTVFPAIAPKITDDWQAFDISFGDIKKLQPNFDCHASSDWTGNIVSFLAGGVEGRSFSMDCMYFYTPKEDSAVEGIEADATLLIGKSTINSTVAGIEVYDLGGALVAKTNSTVLGIENLAKGVYVVKGGNTVQKFVK